MERVEPFAIDVPDSQLADLDHRLGATCFPRESRTNDWSRGMPVATLRELVDHWRTRFDWRAREARLNRYEQFTTVIDGARVHFVRSRAARPGRLPVVITHGWPYSFAEMLPLVDALGGELDVVVPSLPGFTFSDPLPGSFRASAVAVRWHTLMTGVLGYDRYLTYGEDVGAGVSDWLAGLFPQSVAGIVASHASFSARDRDGVALDAHEERFFAWLDDRWRTGRGYAHIQGTRPDTLAAGLSDSPAGLLAWIGEKLAEWSDGDGYSAFGPDNLLTTVSLYWFTNSIGTSFRPYCDPGDPGPHPLIEVPAALIVQTHEGEYPESLARKSYLDLRSFEKLSRGGHFTAFEAPTAIARTILALEALVR